MKPVIKLRDLVSVGEFGFFQEVIKHFPKVTTGDSDPGVSTRWSINNEEMLIHWWRHNASDSYRLELDDGKVLYK